MESKLHGYPLNIRLEDKNKIFISDQICERIGIIINKNDKIVCTIKDNGNSKKLSAVLVLVLLFGVPKKTKAMELRSRAFFFCS